MECFNCISAPDLHLGHRRINIKKSINTFKESIYPLLDSLNILFFPGDFFDHLNSLDSETSLEAINFMKELYFLAIKHNFIIRIVRGTFLHDRNQNKFWNLFKDDNDTIKVFDTISFESILGLDIIYIPDGSPKDTISIIKKILKDRGKKTVDFVIGHGEFEHTLGYGEIPHDTVFKWSDFHDIVNGCVLFGHRHTYNVYKKIIYAGSWERFRHGEEEDKGFVFINYNKSTKKTSVKFHVNRYTDLYKSISFEGISNTEILIEKYKKIVNKLLPQEKEIIYIQVKINDNTQKGILHEVTKQLYPNIILSFKKTKTNIDIKRNNFISNLELITEDNLIDLIYDNIQGQLSKDDIIDILNTI